MSRGDLPAPGLRQAGTEEMKCRLPVIHNPFGKPSAGAGYRPLACGGKGVLGASVNSGLIGVWQR